MAKPNNDRLMECVRLGLIDEVRTTLSSRSTCFADYDLLCCAVKYDRTKIAELILSHGCRVTCQNLNTVSALHLAVETSNLTLIKSLLNRGAPINLQDKTGSTPLNLSVKLGNNSVADLLLNRGASVDICDNNNVSPLHNAVKKNVELVSMLIKSGATVDKRSNQNSTPLHLAAQIGNAEVVRALLSAGASKNVLNSDNESALDLALQNDHDEVVAILLEAEADINLNSSTGKTLLHRAVDEDNFKLTTVLLQKNVNINAADKLNITPIYIAAKNENETMCQLLLSFQADLNICDQDGNSPLLLAVERDNIEIAKLFLDHNAHVNYATKASNNPLYVSALRGNEPLFSLLLKYGAEKWSNVSNEEENETILRQAVNTRCVKIVEFYLQHYSVVTANFNNLLKSAVLHTDEKTENILSKFVSHGFHFKPECVKDCQFIRALIINGYPKIFEEMLMHGLDINKFSETKVLNSNSNGSLQDTDLKYNYTTPLLHTAIQYKQNHIIKLLITHGANVNGTDVLKNTALHCVAENSLRENKIIAELLLSNNANVDCRNDDGCTPLHILVSKKSPSEDFIKLLLKFNVNLNLQNNEGLSALHLVWNYNIAELLITNGADIQIRDNKGRTPFHSAAFKGKVEVFTILLKHNLNIHLEDVYGMTALHLATSDVIAESLIKLGAIVDYKNKRGITPLQNAVINGKSKVVELLIKYDANIDATDNDEMTALHFAITNNRLNIFRLLCECGANINLFDKTKCNLIDFVEKQPFQKDQKDKLLSYLQRHIIKLKLANLFLSQQYLNLNCNLVPAYFQKKCESELLAMKRKQIGETTATFYDFLTTPLVSFVVKNWEQRSFQAAIKSDDWKSEFPNYKNIIQHKITAAERRQGLLP